MNWLTRIFRTYASRALGIAAGVVTAKIAEKTGLIVDPESLVATTLAGYSVVHRAVSSRINPGDAASARMATAEKTAIETGRAVTPERKP